jgi:hypothetical protein
VTIEIIHEIGKRGEFSDAGAEWAADNFCTVLAMRPDALHHIAVGGYKDDPREVWEIPEARAFIKTFANHVLVQLRRSPTEWGLAQNSIAVIVMCVGIGRVVGRTETGQYVIAFGTDDH